MNLLSEFEILDRVKADWSKPSVTFLCTTYNQKDYIGQTIESFLVQKTSFPYQILIHDDKSTDGTIDVIESYRLRYPNIIKCIYQDENKYSQGISPILIAAKESDGDYIALCEGDDYWNNEYKIENQFNLMISDDSISMVVAPGERLRDGELFSDLHCYYGPNKKNVTAQDILDVPGMFAPTPSYMVKKSYLINADEAFIGAPVKDTFIELYCAVFGKLIYSPEVGSVYRLAAKNSWSETMASNKINNQLKFIDAMQQTIERSRSIKGFEGLDWSVKLSAMYYTLALYYLQEKEFENFSKSIEKSYHYAYIFRQQKMLFYLRDHMYLIYESFYPLLLIRRKLKVVLKRS